MPPAPHDAIWLLANGWVASRCLQTVAEAGIADHISDEPRSAAEVASGAGVDADALDRILRLLSAHGVFARTPDGRYAHTDASRLLRTDHPRSMRGLARMHNLPQFAGCSAEFAHSLRTGRPAAEALGAGGLFDLLGTDPAAGRIFDEAMAAKARADVPAVVAAVDWTSVGTVADVGGGRGHLLRAILEAHPGVRGILVDLPEVVAAAPDPPERMRLHGADFFSDDLPAADAYVLMEVIHDWADAESAAILTAVRRAARAGARVLIVENLLVEDAVDLRGWTLDVLMLAVAGGRERTPAELATLLDAAGFDLARVTPTGGRLTIVEATAR